MKGSLCCLSANVHVCPLRKFWWEGTWHLYISPVQRFHTVFICFLFFWCIDGIDGIDGWANALRVPFFLPGNLGECRRERKIMPLDATWRKSAAAESEDTSCDCHEAKPKALPAMWLCPCHTMSIHVLCVLVQQRSTTAWWT